MRSLVTTLQQSHLGRAWYAIREDEIAAQTSGVPLADYKSLVFALGGTIAGLAGSLLAHQYTYISPDIFNLTISTLALTIVVLGGMGQFLRHGYWRADPGGNARTVPSPARCTLSGLRPLSLAAGTLPTAGNMGKQ